MDESCPEQTHSLIHRLADMHAPSRTHTHTHTHTRTRTRSVTKSDLQFHRYKDGMKLVLYNISLLSKCPQGSTLPLTGKEKKCPKLLYW